MFTSKQLWGMGIVGGLTFLSLLFVPVFPDSTAQPQAVKTKTDEIHHRTPGDFAEGKTKNMEIEPRGKKGILTLQGSQKEGEYISPAIRSDIDFTAVGVHWMDQTSGKAEHRHEEEATRLFLRTSKDGDDWSDWREIHVGHAQGPDHMKNEETFGDLLFQSGRYMQYKVEMESHQGKTPRLSDLKLTALNSKEDASAADAKEQQVSFARWMAQTAKASVERPDVVSREEWGADESLRYKDDGSEDWPREYADEVTHLSVHHTETPNDDEENGISPAERMRSIYYYHAKTRGWGDIGYNAIIGYDGKVYEGRKGKDNDVLTPGVVGAHTYSFNHGAFGVSLMGDFEESQLPGHMRESLVDLLAYQADLHTIDPQGKADYIRDYEYDDPNVPERDEDVPTLQGHQDFPRASTACPGQFTHSDLDNIRRDVAAQLEGEQGIVTVDNTDPANQAEGNWVKSTNVSGYYGSNYQANDSGSGADTFTWNFDLPETGEYRVSVYYTAAFDRATDAPYEIHTQDGPVTKKVNQQENGSTWIELGTYSFDAGSNRIVQTDDADGYVIADGVRLEKVESEDPSPEPEISIIDNADSGSISSAGNWPTSTNVSGYYGDNYQPNAAGSGDDTFTWNFDPPETGVYRVSVHYTAASDRASDAPYTVEYADGQTTQRIDQRTNGGEWVDLGSFHFEKGSPGKVTLTDDADGYVIADAVRFERESGVVISDNARSDNEGVGAWKDSNNVSGYYGSNYQYDYKGDGSHTFTWNLDIPETGYYKVYAKHLSHTDRATDAPYTVHHGEGETVQRINQQKNSGEWVELGTFRFDEGTGNKVVLSDDADGIVVADAVKLEPAPVTVTADNADDSSEADGAWKPSNNVSGYNGVDYQYDYKGDGSHTFTWNFDIPESGSYKVYVKYLSHTDRATDAPYTIHHRDGSTTQNVDQRSNGSRWVSVGTYTFDQGKGKVVLSDDADGIVVADAVRLVKE
ncbi:golvesin C-terminal-like domain-containing protein [Paludifilum halophilum]|uniref:Peptidoglycan recognition protein family domain-containing protein n=1 Tax=Paludifilum halophilum TaxID=1642702 RepID=A0A235B5P5_9BACL|nr:N-acetylmuramoyl-L-alanine amidase [Paludifilum halophilum]OYD06915.1 hypothetical protein CHM34_13315 [Paludifilum halophilum]